MPAELREQLQATLGSAYTLERELGGGGMSRVFVAHEARLGRRVVVKVLSPQLAAGISSERFEREMRMAAQLQDPRIVPVLSAGDTGGLPFYTMPFVEGESLRARMTRERVPLTEAIALLRDIALALEHAHAHGIVHRDIKPENILLSSSTAVVTDFGIAKAIATSTDQSMLATLTNQGLALGTPAYMAPEQALGDASVDARADLYAWGVVAFELLAGEHPFGMRGSSQAMVAAHISETPPALGTRAARLPVSLAALVDRALAKDPAGRPPNAGEIVRTLNDVLSPGGGQITAGWSRTRRLTSVVIAAVLVAAVAVVARSWSPARGAGEAATVQSLAVMPFIGEAGDTSTAYLSDGMADALTTTLAKLPELRVVANRSAVATPSQRLDVQAVGRKLNVDAVLEGAVHRVENRLRIHARLTRVSDGTVLWGEKYDHTASNMFALEDEVTTAIASELRGALSGGRAAVAAGVPRGTTNEEAYDLYLRGRYAWGKRGERGLGSAIELFKQAIARDPRFARAHAGLAMTYVVLPVFTASISVDSALAMAMRSANRALTLDSSLADAHLAMAYGHKMRWQWEDAERHFRNAVALAPNDAGIHHWYGVHLYAVGDADSSVAAFERARALDPFATTIATDGAIAFYAARRMPEAQEEVGRSLVMDQTRSDTWFIQGVIQLGAGAPDSAIVSFDQARRRGTTFDMRPYISVAYRTLGRRREADSLYAALRRDYQAGRALPYDVAIAAIHAGDRAEAFSALDRMVERRDLLVTEVSFPCDVLFDPVRSDPRFATVLVRARMKACAP